MLKLEDLGFDDVAALLGGYRAWVDAGYTTESSKVSWTKALGIATGPRSLEERRRMP